MKKNTFKKGYSLVEVIAYIAMFTVLLSAVTYGTMVLVKSYRDTKSVRKVENSALASMDRMVREIRNATSVDTGASSFGNSSGILTINNGPSTTTRFYLSNQRIYVDENGAVLGPITLSSVRVTSLIFRHIATTTSEAIKIEMTMAGHTSSPSVSENFYNTAVLRGSYE